jgi:tetratricopeptide (TPR) repeat protein
MGRSRWARLKASVAAVVDAPSSRVSVLLRQAVEGHGSIYSMARSLVRLRSDASGFLESVPASPTSNRTHRYALTPDTLLANRYRILHARGSGGMGEVFECFDTELNEPVAIKILHSATIHDAEFLHRFRAELSLGRRIRHPNVCRLYELQSADCEGKELLFFTMELLTGETLNDAVARAPFTELDALPIVGQIIAGVQAIHDAGILHRDLKCSNIMLLPVSNGVSGVRAVVMDFGLAQQIDSIDTTMTALARGSFAGTPAYMPPEQLQGGTLSPASDIHALGVVMFRMVTGRFPFPGRTPLQMAVQRLNGRVRSPRLMVSTVSRRWEAAVLACLESDPTRRPQTARDVADFLYGRKTLRRARRTTVAVALVVALAAAGFGLDAYRRRPAAPDPEAVRHYQLGQEFVDRRQGEDLQQAVVEFERAIGIQPSFAPAMVGLAEAYSALANWGLVEPQEALSRSRAAAERALRLDANLATAHAVLGYTISIDVTRWREATAYFSRALALDSDNPKVLLWYAAHLGRLGRTDEAIRQIRVGLQLKPADMLLNHQLATEYFRGRRYPEFYKQAEELVRLQPFQANSHLVRARALAMLGRYDEATEACRTAEKYSLDRSQLVLMLGIIAAERGAPADARRYATEAEGFPRSRHVDLAGLYAKLGRYDKSLEHLRAGLANGDSSVLSAGVTPYFDAMRSYPPFQAFLRQIGAAR